MSEFLTVLTAVLPIFCIAGAGVLLRQLNWLTADADASLLRVTVNVLTPCLIFDSILGNQAFAQPGNIWLPPLIGFGTVALGVPFALLLRGATGLRDERARRTFTFVAATYNYGYVPVPLILALFPKEIAAPTLAVLFVHNVGVEIALWSLGLMILGGGTLRDNWRKILNPPLLAIVLTLALNFIIGSRPVPEFIHKTAHMLGQCAIPFGVLMIGATMADFVHEFRSVQGVRLVLVSCVLRLGILPILFLLLAKYLPCPVELKRVITIQAAMAAAVFPIVMAKHYGGDPATAVRVVLGTSLVGLVTIPLWLRFGLKWVGL
ncbi:MAG TPA: AEC family transporter [Candidatus Limnocylindria bacterium]|nr:AEC family transporter [Candidatus Limnocylindria bacterium]